MKKKIKLCYVINRLPDAGSVSVVYNIISNLDNERYDVSLVTISCEKEKTQLGRFKTLPIELHLCPEATQLSIIDKFKRLKSVFKEIEPDVVHAHCVRSLVFCVLLKKHYKLIFTGHNYPGAVEKVMYGKFLGTFLIWATNIFSRITDRSVVCSESISIDLCA